MPNPVMAMVVGGTMVGGQVAASKAQKKAAGTAAGAQLEAARLGIEEQRRQFDTIQELMRPYIQAGMPALEQQQALMGLLGEPAQREAISGIEASPMFDALARQGEEAILQQASATGGLRGGNVQAALAQFRPQMLAQQIQQRFANLGNLTSLGQASAAGQASAGQATGVNIANLLAQQGAAKAGQALAVGESKANLYNLPAQMMGMYIGAGGKF